MHGRWGNATDRDAYRFFSPEQVDQILCEGLRRGRAGSHAAIERILKARTGTRTGRTSGAAYANSNSLQAKQRYCRIVWSAEDDQILSLGYEKGWAGKQEAVRELLKRHPDWRPHVIWKRAAKLHLIRKVSNRWQDRSHSALVRARQPNSSEPRRLQDSPRHREDAASVRGCRSLPPHASWQEQPHSLGRLFAPRTRSRPASGKENCPAVDRGWAA